MDISNIQSNSLPFIKMHGIGNDYIYLDNVTYPVPEDLPALSRRLSDRHCSIGGDGIIVVGKPNNPDSDFSMRIFNADGSEAKMCGNGIRCVGKLVYDHGLTKKLSLRIDTLSGMRTLELHPGSDGRIATVTVAMGIPSQDPESVGITRLSDDMTDFSVEGMEPIRLTAVSMGNPHGVMIVDNVNDADVHGTGRILEMHPMWKDRANIEFVEVIDRGHIRMRVWERGSGETMACGTGACASVAACVLLGVTDRNVRVDLLGGSLQIRWSETDGQIYMTGPAEEAFRGIVDL